MATRKQSFVRATEPRCSESAQREEEAHVQARLTTMYVQNVQASGLQPYPQAQPGALQDATVVPLFLPRMCSNSTLPSLTLHIASTAALQQQRLVAPASAGKPKSLGKHICPHCGKDCLKPSVLEKHLRCHTGERPYPCTTCGISFKTQSNLYKHKRTQAHARHSSESEKGTFSSQESMESSKDNCLSSSVETKCVDSADARKVKEVFSTDSVTTPSQTDPAETGTMSGIEWALQNAAMVGISTTPALQDKVNSLRKTVEFSVDAIKQTNVMKNAVQQTSALTMHGCTPLSSNRTPLQRQEALFSKPSFPFLSNHCKAQSHDSTDSGFSDSSEHHSSSSPGASLHDPSAESLTETSMVQQESAASQMPSEMTSEDPKSKVSIQEKQKLEERISKLIYENSVLVDNKLLENVRPRKTILSKQGSIDLPVPYTYKDSFHFEIRNSKHILSSQNPDRGGRVVHSSLPTQQSASLEHAPLTRSSSLPFSMGSKPAADGAGSLNLSRRCSAGHVYPIRPSNQRAATHRSLVRQVAVDCLYSAEAERGSMSSLSSDGDSTEVGTESCVKANYRRKTQKFDYTKWHTYKGGTFRKLYNAPKDCILKAKKTTSSTEPTESLDIQRHDGSMCTSSSVVPLQNELKVSHISFESNNVKGANVEDGNIQITQHTACHVPSERKKQRTESDVQTLSIADPKKPQDNGNLCELISQTLFSSAENGSITVHRVNMQNVHSQSNFTQPFSNPSQFLGNSSLSGASCLVSMSGASGTPSGSISSPTVPKAKTSFPPMYQLKIPCPADGVSASCSGSTSAHNACSNAFTHSHQTAEERHAETAELSSKQHTRFHQSKQEVLCETTSMPVLSVSYLGLNQTNSLSKVMSEIQSTTNTSASLASAMPPPLVQHQVSSLRINCASGVVENQSSSASHQPFKTLENSRFVTSTTSYCSQPGPKIYSPVTTLQRVQNHPSFPVIESGKPKGCTENITSTDYENTQNSIASNIPSNISEESPSEGEVVLLNGSAQAQNTFYVRTADLQIVMQLISDEQLALIEPHIETTSSAQTTLSQEVYSTDVSLCEVQEMISNGEKEINSTFSCSESRSANRAETVCSLTSHNGKSHVNAIPQCVSSWSHPQTRFHISPSMDYCKNTKQPQEFPEIISSGGFELESSHKLVDGDTLTEPESVESSYPRGRNDREPLNCIDNKDRVSSTEDSTETTRDEQMESNHMQTINTTELNDTGHLVSVALSGNDESVHTDSTTHLAAESQKQPSDCKTGLDTREIKACDTNKVTETCPEQTATQHDFQPAFAPGDFGNDTYSGVKSSCLTPDRTSSSRDVFEDSIERGDVHTRHANLEMSTGSGEDGVLKNLRFQRDSRTDRRESRAKIQEDGDEEVKRSTDRSSCTCRSSEETDKEVKRKDQAVSSGKHQTSTQANPHFSQEVSFNVSQSLHHEKLHPETSVCTDLIPPNCQSKGENSSRTDSMGEYLGNSPSPESDQREMSSLNMARCSNQTCRHLALANTTQSEYQKETQARGATSYWIYSKGTHVQMHKTSSTSASVHQNNCAVSNTETVNASAPPSSSDGSRSRKESLQMTIQEAQTHQMCAPATHSSSSEPKQLYLGSSSYLELEDSNSSSDDEQKLVIELE
ncbi:zinc finger protein 831 [Danio aesculapii]|uniref:zinc finger protein 831 n=1 Tax=Danio aesculapii TaxID=1142201 RepID=UPI0024BF7B04|nr:zinc finger protein 831 [Danio aesculapii]XP_056324754.1 zinc finger protein 831 [Danio aesculapii]XP_056324755.1 zinc finger protein 831 [Danio aesculapii]